MTPPVTPPRSWFDPPSAEELQVVGGRANQMSVGKDGRLFGIAAIRGTCHIGFSDQCVDVPRSVTDYAYFHTGEVECDDGSVVATGPIVIDTVHPSLRLAASDAQAFYADTGCALADVRMHDMTVGSQELVVYAGALRPTVSPTQLRTLRGSDGVSPDWRRIGGNLEQVALLAVNLSGFKVPALVASGGVDADVVLPGQPRVLIDGERIQALVAAGAPVSSSEARFTELAAQHEALLFELDDLRAAVAPVLAERRQARLSLALDRALAPRRARATAALDRLAAAMDATEQFAPAKRKSGWEAARKKHGEDAWNRNGPKKGESGASKKTEAKKTAKAKAAPAAGVAPRGRSEVMRDAQDANRDVQKLYRAAHEVGPDTVQPLDDLSDSLADVEYAAEQGLAGELAGAYRNAAERAGIAAEGFRGVKRGPGGVDYAAKLKTLQGDLQSEADRWDGVDRWE